LVDSGRLDPHATIAAVLTGHVLKDTEYIIKHQAREEEAMPKAVALT
jgi:hypothetical protein